MRVFLHFLNFINYLFTKLTGDWEEGQLKNGKWLFPTGTIYEGQFKYNKPDGKGVWKFLNGNQITGNYKQEIIPNEDEVPT